MANQPVSFIASLSRLNKILIVDRRDIAGIYIFAILAGLVQLTLPLGIQSIISFVMAGSLSTSIVVLIAMVVFGVFANGFVQVRQLQIIEKIRQKLFVRYSMAYSERIPRLNIEKLDGVYLPEIVNRYFDSLSLQKGLDKLLIDLPAAIIQVMLGLLLLAFYHPIFIALGLALIMIVVTIIRVSSAPGLQTALRASTYKYSVAAWLQEIARTVKTFKYTRGTSMHLQKTDVLAGEYLVSRTRHFKILLSQFWSLISFKIIITAAMLTIGSYLLINQQINVGQFIAADIVIIAIIGSIEKLILNLDTVYDGLVSVEKLSVITDAEIEQSGNLMLAANGEGVALEFENVSFAYSDHPPVFKNESFRVEKGQIVQIKGISGAGKSTLLRLFTGAFRNFTGNVLIEGAPIGNYNIESLRKSTGILLGSQDIFEGTIWENLTMGDDSIEHGEVTRLVEITGLSHFVRSCKQGYDTILLPVGNKLSKNVQKNILLVRALLGKQRLLLLEEPFSHLSNPYYKNVIDYIKTEKKATTLIASTDEGLHKFCDKTIVLGHDRESQSENNSERK